mmetsp:Transcript_37410/g.74195  ORF Transcript_37410/g.74195 Transcript_37410/m.74195 type:complete len:83 (-) Transcript_37410:338-586(-)
MTPSVAVLTAVGEPKAEVAADPGLPPAATIGMGVGALVIRSGDASYPAAAGFRAIGEVKAELAAAPLLPAAATGMGVGALEL